MGSPNKRVPKSPLKQWVLYQGAGVCTGMVVSGKSKVIKNKSKSKIVRC